MIRYIAIAAFGMGIPGLLGAAADQAALAQPAPNAGSAEGFLDAPELLAGGFPAKDPWLGQQVDARRSLGLPHSVEDVVPLLSSPEAQSQVAAYGAVLSKTEETDLETAHSQQTQLASIKHELSQLDGWAGSEIAWIDEYRVQELTIWMKFDALDEAAARLEQVTDGIQVDFEVRLTARAHSWVELETAQDELNAALIDGRRPDANSELVVATYDYLREVGAGFVGMSIRDNSLVAYFRPGDPLPEATTPAKAFPIVARVLEEEPVDTGPPSCDRTGCHTTRGGIRIFSANNGDCTTGFAVVDGSDEDWVTAAHCVDPDPVVELQGYFLRASGSYPSHFDHTTRANIGPDQSRNTANGSRSEQVEIGETDQLVTNRVYIDAASPGQLITSVESTTTLSYNDRVCVSGKSSGYRCGLVTDPSDTSQINGTSYSDQVRATYVSTNGDSGAPVVMQYQRSRAVSIHSGGNTGDKASSKAGNLWSMDSGTGVYIVTDKKRDWVLALYIHGLGWIPPGNDVTYWIGQLNTCNLSSAKTVAAAFFKHNNFRVHHPIGTDSGRKIRVEKLYNVLLGRASDTNGLNGYASGVTSEGQWDATVDSFLNSSEFNNRVLYGSYSQDGSVC